MYAVPVAVLADFSSDAVSTPGAVAGRPMRVSDCCERLVMLYILSPNLNINLFHNAFLML